MLPLVLSMLFVPPTQMPVPESLQRTIRTFDFEESKHQRLDLPMGFDRVIPHGTGDPAVFGTTQPDAGSARSGDYAFLFELDGQSMAARTRPGMIPVRPGTDLDVSTWVHMDDVDHAGARLVAWLADADGRRISPVTTSPFLEDTAGWTRLHVVVEGRTLKATELITELQVLQLGHRTDVHSLLPPPIDVHGRVRFDDVTVMQRPSIRLDDGLRHGLHPHGTTPILQLHLFDPIPEPVQWSLTIEDADGTVLARHAGSIPDGESVLEIETPSPMRGWYRATLTATTTQGLQARDVLDYVVLAPGSDASDGTGTLHLTRWPTDADIRMASTLSVETISVPLVNVDGQPISGDAAVRTRLDAYLDRGGSLELHLDTLPAEWCTELALDHRQISDFSALGGHHWKPLADAAAVHWGPAAAQWRLGGDADARSIELWKAHLRTLVPDAVVSNAPEHEADLIGALQDGTLRITPPWTSDRRGRMRPTRDYMAHHTLLTAMRDRRCAGMIRIAPETEGWVLEGTNGRRDALLIHRADGALDTNALAVGEDAHRIDMDGNSWQLDHRDTMRSWTTAHTPFLIENTDDRLLHLQRDLQLQPDALPARARRHVHRIQIVNPLPTTMQGTLRFTGDDRIQIEPALLQIELKPNQQRLIDVDLLVNGPLPLGPHAIDAMLHLQQPHNEHVAMRCWIDVGLPDLDIDVTSTPTTAGPLDVTISIRNLGDTTRMLDARIAGRNMNTMPDRRITLLPGETGGHRFLVHIDPAASPGPTIHAHIAEVEASGRVQVAITLPDTVGLATVDPLDP